MKLRIFNDTHLFGVNPSHTLDEILGLTINTPSDREIYFLGDIVDVANVEKSRLKDAITTLRLLRDNFNFIRGNHEKNAIEAPDFKYLGDNEILLTHGDIFMWGIERANKYRSGKKGAGPIKRKIIAPLIDDLRRFWTVRPNNRLLEAIRAEKKKNPKLRYVVMGHSHPKTMVTFDIDGVTGMILPRGYTDLELL
jgi:UDP-2,3-diacylglucosamine pyrophosphatase LpxH